MPTKRKLHGVGPAERRAVCDVAGHVWCGLARLDLFLGLSARRRCRAWAIWRSKLRGVGGSRMEHLFWLFFLFVMLRRENPPNPPGSRWEASGPWAHMGVGPTCPRAWLALTVLSYDCPRGHRDVTRVTSLSHWGHTVHVSFTSQSQEWRENPTPSIPLNFQPLLHVSFQAVHSFGVQFK